MTVPPATRRPAPFSALKRLVARHPVAAFLVMVYVVNCAVALVPLLTRRGILPFGLAPYDALGHIFGVALPTFLVVAATHGRTGVRDLARRSLRWRVGVRWYLIALLGVPIRVVLGASAIYGLAPLNALVEKWRLLLTGIFGISQLFGRIIIMWLYNNTNFSVLLVGMFHSSFNVTTSAFGPFIPVPAGSMFLIAAPVVAVAAVLIVVFARGRLSYKPEHGPQPTDAAPPHA